jgi:hypothetical protein
MKVILASVVAVATATTYEAEFAEFKTLYKSQGYTSTQEEATRFAIFQKNMVKADALTLAEEGRAQFGVTKFADMTPEEFKAMLGYKPIADTTTIAELDIRCVRAHAVPALLYVGYLSSNTLFPPVVPPLPPTAQPRARGAASQRPHRARLDWQPHHRGEGPAAVRLVLGVLRNGTN